MNATKIKNGVQHVIEGLLILAFFISAVSLLFSGPVGGEGFLAIVFGSRIALLIYAVWFFAMSIGLVYAKFRNKKRLHKHILLAMYLTTIYTTALTWAVAGPLGIFDDVLLGVGAAWCWLRWKLVTEYVDPKHFQVRVEEFRDDLPPS